MTTLVIRVTSMYVHVHVHVHVTLSHDWFTAGPPFATLANITPKITLYLVLLTSCAVNHLLRLTMLTAGSVDMLDGISEYQNSNAFMVPTHSFIPVDSPVTCIRMEHSVSQHAAEKNILNLHVD